VHVCRTSLNRHCCIYEDIDIDIDILYIHIYIYTYIYIYIYIYIFARSEVPAAGGLLHLQEQVLHTSLNSLLHL
jgi:hypothetical protein